VGDDEVVLFVCLVGCCFSGVVVVGLELGGGGGDDDDDVGIEEV